MYSQDDPLSRYAAGNLQTASASKIVTMCFDRLDRDLVTAADSIERSDHYECNMALGHAQDLLGEMAGMLDLDVWEHAGSLVALYDYLLRLLAVANTFKDAGLVAEGQRIVRELGDAFRAAAEQPAVPTAGAAALRADHHTTAPVDASATGADRPTEGDRPRLSIQA